MRTYLSCMPKRSRKKNEDANEIAFRVVRESTADHDSFTRPNRKKDPAAVALGRKGGKKGGPARAAKMTAEERSESARKAARARWGDES